MTGTTRTGAVIAAVLCVLALLPATASARAGKKGDCSPGVVKELVALARGDQGAKVKDSSTAYRGYYMKSPGWAMELLSIYAEAVRTRRDHSKTEDVWYDVAERRGYGEITYDEMYPIVRTMMHRDNKIWDSMEKLAPKAIRARVTAIKLLGDRGCVEAAPDMKKLFVERQDTLYRSTRLRHELLRSAAIAYADLAPEAARELLPGYLTHDHPSYRMSAVESLTLLEGEDITGLLIGMLEDESWDVRLSAWVALYSRPYPPMRDTLVEMLGYSDFFTVKAALETLAKQVRRGQLTMESGDPELIEALEALMEEVTDEEGMNHAKDAAPLLEDLKPR